jgi:hypothetical protein
MHGDDQSDSPLASRVTRTGIALVHEGEIILPAPGSEADAIDAIDDRYTVHYHFPVEIEIRGPEPNTGADDAAQRSHQMFALTLDGL